MIFLLFLIFHLANKGANDANFFILVLIEIKTKPFCISELHQVVVEGLLRNLYFECGLL